MLRVQNLTGEVNAAWTQHSLDLSFSGLDKESDPAVLDFGDVIQEIAASFDSAPLAGLEHFEMTPVDMGHQSSGPQRPVHTLPPGAPPGLPFDYDLLAWIDQTTSEGFDYDLSSLNSSQTQTPQELANFDGSLAPHEVAAFHPLDEAIIPALPPPASSAAGSRLAPIDLTGGDDDANSPHQVRMPDVDGDRSTTIDPMYPNHIIILGPGVPSHINIFGGNPRGPPRFLPDVGASNLPRPRHATKFILQTPQTAKTMASDPSSSNATRPPSESSESSSSTHSNSSNSSSEPSISTGVQRRVRRTRIHHPYRVPPPPPAAPTSLPPSESATTSSTTQSSTDSQDKWKCPHCDYVQANRRKPDLRRHIETHSPGQFWICCGLPLDETGGDLRIKCANRTLPEEYGPVLVEIGPGVGMREREGKGSGKVRWVFGKPYAGGCGRRYARRDYYLKHLRKEAEKDVWQGACVGDADGLWHPGNHDPPLRIT